MSNNHSNNKKEWIPSEAEWLAAQGEIDQYLKTRKRRLLVWWMTGAVVLLFMFNYIMKPFSNTDAIESKQATKADQILQNNKTVENAKLESGINEYSEDQLDNSTRQVITDNDQLADKLRTTRNSTEQKSTDVINSKKENLIKTKKVNAHRDVQHGNSSDEILNMAVGAKAKEDWKEDWNGEPAGDEEEVANEVVESIAPNNTETNIESNIKEDMLSSTIASLGEMNKLPSLVAALKAPGTEISPPAELLSDLLIGKRVSWSWSPYLKLNYLNGSLNDGRINTGEVQAGIEFIKNKSWGVFLGVGVGIFDGEFGETRRVYVDQPDFGANFERWNVHTNTILQAGVQVGVVKYFNQNALRLTANVNRPLGAWAQIDHSDIDVFALRVDGQPTKETDLGTLWIKDFGQANYTASLSLEYERNLTKRLSGSIGLDYSINRNAQWKEVDQRSEVRTITVPEWSPIALKLGLLWRI